MKNSGKKVWGVLGKQQSFVSNKIQGQTIPLNANPLEPWDARKSRYKRVDLVPKIQQLIENAEQGGVVPQITITPSPTPSPTPAFDPDAQAFFDAITASGGTLTSTEENAVNDLVIDLKNDNLWTKMIALYPVVGGVELTHRFNLKNPSAYTLTYAGTWTHSSAGVSPGSNGYANTFLNPSVVNFALSGSVHFSMYITEDFGNGGYDMGVYNPIGGEYAVISEYLNNNTTYIQVGTSGFLTVANGGSTKKHWIWTNTGATSYIYRDGTSLVSGAKAMATGPNNPITISALNDINNGSPWQFAQRNWALASIGLGMDSTDATNYTTIVTTFQTALGRQN